MSGADHPAVTWLLDHILWNALIGACVLLPLTRCAVKRRREASVAAEDNRTPEQKREDMIYIWTEVHGIPRERAESMWESYERASAVASLGLKGK
jgi:hypothetical protein